MKRKIFIDCGAHKGESIRKFLSCFADADEYELFSVEPNGLFAQRLKNEYGDVSVINKAAWIEDGKINFYGTDEPNRTDGYTIVEEKSDISHNSPVEVECFDLSKWIKNEFSSDDYIVLKLDVEGAEYSILDKMVKEGTISFINELYVEFHIRWMDMHRSVHDDIIKQLQSLGIKPKEWDAIDPNFIPGRPIRSMVLRFYRRIMDKLKSTRGT
jgi:FkbM family methyltransferase